MPTSYCKNKEHIYKWRVTHKSGYNDYQNNFYKNMTPEQKEKRNERIKELRELRKDEFYCECERLIKMYNALK